MKHKYWKKKPVVNLRDCGCFGYSEISTHPQLISSLLRYCSSNPSEKNINCILTCRGVSSEL